MYFVNNNIQCHKIWIIFEKCSKIDDYELYMSNTGSIFSPDHKSVAYITYFGDIEIDPVFELNSILSLKSEYRRPCFNSDKLYQTFQNNIT